MFGELDLMESHQHFFTVQIDKVRMVMLVVILKFLPFVICRHAVKRSVCDTLIVPHACIQLSMGHSSRQVQRAVGPSVMLKMPLSVLTPLMDLMILVWMAPLLAKLAGWMGYAV